MGIVDRPTYCSDSVVEFRTHQIKAFKQLFDSIKHKLPDTSLLFHQDCMKIMQLDAANTFLVNVNLDGNEFEHYYCNPDVQNGEDVIDINVSAVHLNQVFKCITKDDTIFVFIYRRGPDGGNSIQIVFENSLKSEKRTFDIPIQNPDEENPVGEMNNDIYDYEYSLTMPSADLVRICRELKAMDCEKVRITHDGKTLQFNSNGFVKASIVRHGAVSDHDAHELKFTKLPDDENRGIYRDTFKFSTLYEFSKSHAGGDSKIVKILLNTDSPLILCYEIGTLGDMNIALASLVAANDNN